MSDLVILMRTLMKSIITLIAVLSLTVVNGQTEYEHIVQVLRPVIMKQSEWAKSQQPVTITSFVASRSSGSIHDFFSEGDYWWPDPTNPDGPYIQRDGQTNPENFVSHREALMRFSRIMGALGSAYVLTKDTLYVRLAMEHALAWFVNPATRMNPSLEFAQAIKGRVTGRGIGIIDTIHLMEVVEALRAIESAPNCDDTSVYEIKKWFKEYVYWLTHHSYGADEMNALNNHGTCWVMQVACFARFTGDGELLEFCRERYKTELLAKQMDSNGSFPRELARTKPYGYSIFNLDAMTTICQILSDRDHDLWTISANGRTIESAVAFLFPYLKDKSSWPYPRDVMYWNEWPVAQPCLLFAGLRFKNPSWFELWTAQEHDPQNFEVQRNLPVRHPLLWINSR